MQTTWKPHEAHGQLTAKGDLPDTVFAFPKQRKEPLTDAQHVRNAVARFDQVMDVSADDRALAFANIEKAAEHYGVELSETSWRDFGVHPHRALAFANIEKAAEHYGVELSETSWRDFGVHPQAHRKEAAAKAVETKRKRGELRSAAAKGAATRRRERAERGG
jgi:hypothetical protein